MLKIVHLGPKEKPPAGERFFLIECKPGLRREQAIYDEKGSTNRIRPEDYPAVIAGIRQKAKVLYS